jgi:hypothetical protein
MTFLVLVCAQNLCGHQGSCLQSSFTCVVKKFWIPSSFADLESCHRQLNLGAAAARQQNTSPQGRAGGPPFPDGIPDKPPNCRNELQTLWCWKQTHERQKILTRQFLFIKWVQACTYSSWADTRAQNASPHIPDSVVPAPHLGFVQVRGSQSFWLAKGLGDGLGHVIWWAVFRRQWDCIRIQKKQEPFKQRNSLKMVTWGILIHLRGWYILW